MQSEHGNWQLHPFFHGALRGWWWKAEVKYNLISWPHSKIWLLMNLHERRLSRLSGRNIKFFEAHGLNWSKVEEFKNRKLIPNGWLVRTNWNFNQVLMIPLRIANLARMWSEAYLGEFVRKVSLVRWDAEGVSAVKRPQNQGLFFSAFHFKKAKTEN